MLWVYKTEQVQLVEPFPAADPWNGNRPASFRLDRCFPGGFVPDWAAFEEQSVPHHYALRSDLAEEHHVLPDALAALWLQKKVPAARLPALLAGLEPELRRSDFIRLLTLAPMQRAIRTWAPPALGVILALAGATLLAADVLVGLLLALAGVAVTVGSVKVLRRLAARRAQQMDAALAGATATVA